ncbi:MAG: hypothetical protein HKP58_15170, partial [Desulfatitalea sp.]|nr:hypothetical protein [Desulfatitalea sp.]NNK01750.1 hypothetical protein [Desulfatitalea sp.]
MKRIGAKFPLILLIMISIVWIQPCHADELTTESDAPRNSGADTPVAVGKLDEMVVTATKTPHKLKDVPVETVVITAEEIAKTNAKNAMGVLKEIPGISIANHDDVFGTY